MSEVAKAEKHVIIIDGNLSGDIPPKAKCTCGWETEPNSKLMDLGTAAFNHRDETGHGLRNSTFGMSD